MEIYLNRTSDSPNKSTRQSANPEQQYVKGCWISSRGRLTFWQCSHCGFIADSSGPAFSCPACVSRPLAEVLNA